MLYVNIDMLHVDMTYVDIIILYVIGQKYATIADSDMSMSFLLGGWE